MDTEKIFKNFISSCSDSAYIVNLDGEISFANMSAREKFGNISNIFEFEHLFSFEIYMLNSEDIFDYTPIKAAIEAKEDFVCECSFIGNEAEAEYKQYQLCSYAYDGKKVFIFKDISLKNAEIEYKNLQKELIKTTQEKNDVAELQTKLQNQFLRSALVNLVSGAIREHVDIKEIIKIVLSETAKTLNTYKSEFIYFDGKNPIFKDIIDENAVVSSVIDGKILRARLVCPVYCNNELMGVLDFYFKNNQRLWQKEEITLIENIALQLSTAFHQSKLFENLNFQKAELEKAFEELKQTQTYLVQSEKMASLGQLVAGVAHEINTPLGTINSNLDIQQKCCEKVNGNPDKIDAKVVKMLTETNKINKEAINRINKIVKSLKTFVRLDEAEMKRVNILDGIQSTLDLLQHEIKNRIKIIENYQPIPQVLCYPDSLNQVFMNVLVNACQSIEGEGTIEISVFQTGNNVAISITDSGVGIKKENLQKIFDPGFTTKGVGIGSGLGLSIVHKIIEKHNGKISVRSKESQGTTFEIILPIDILTVL